MALVQRVFRAVRARRSLAHRKRRLDGVGFDYAVQPKREVDSCNLCGNRTFVTITRRDRYGLAAQSHGCTRCGLVFLSPLMTPNAYKEFYEGIYRPLLSAYSGRPVDERTIQGKQKAYAAELADFLAPAIGKNMRTCLDIGGSTGIVAAHLGQRFGLEGTVLDPAPAEISEASRLGLETIVSLLEDFQPMGRTFDLVTMCKTIDHVLDVAAAMSAVRRLLSPSGMFFVDIVDFRYACVHYWSPEAVVKVDHPYYLTEATMEAFLTRHGFEVVRKRSVGPHIGYLCRPGVEVPHYLPDPSTVERLFREVRYIQSVPFSARDVAALMAAGQ